MIPNIRTKNLEQVFNSDSLLKKRWRLPGEPALERALGRLSISEKFFAGILIAVMAFSSFTLLFKTNYALMAQVPTKGGSLTEGIVGSPRFVNPVLALPGSDPDRDLVALIYSGLLKAEPNGNLIPNLAEKFTISEDGLTYHFTLKENVFFHDGKPVTAEDVEFTILKIQEPALRSPKRANWEGVKIEVQDSKNIIFTLSRPYAPFLENATIGVLPKHIWNNLSSDQFSFSLLNVEPIGSGPYKIKSVKKDSNGIPVSYNLSPFKNYALGEPFIKTITLKFYSNEKDLLTAYEKGLIESVYAIQPEEAKKLQDSGREIKTVGLPRIFGLFLNQNQASIFTHKEVREALNLALDKTSIVEEALFGYGKPVLDNSPIPPSYQNLKSTEINNQESYEEKLNRAIDLLEKNGWTLEDGETFRKKETRAENFELKFSISTSNIPELKSVAEIMKRQWEKIGAEVEIKIFEANGDLSQNVIRPRKYDALLFGTSFGRDLDLFPFWHSSQRNDPGFNIALYANITTDKLLEEIRIISNNDDKIEKYKSLESEIIEDTPAIFIYSPEFIYITPPKVQNLKIDFISHPADRFLNIHEWYITTDNVWKIFSNIKKQT